MRSEKRLFFSIVNFQDVSGLGEPSRDRWSLNLRTPIRWDLSHPQGSRKPSVKCYQMGDIFLSHSALTRPAEVPAWMASVAPKSRAYVTRD